MANTNKGFLNASIAKKDEFYTQLTDIEKEMRFYEEQFRDKVIFLNCDDPEYSNFWIFFQYNFFRLGLKKLISTHYEYDKPSYKMEIVARETTKKIKGVQLGVPDYVKTPLLGNGDFRSDECIKILEESDIVITNPPFSLFREFVAQLIEHNKKFLIIGNQNALTYKEFFPLVKDNKVWYGASIHSHGRDFRVPDDYPLKAFEFRVDEHGNKFINVKGVRWFTNLDYKERHEDLILYKTYNSSDYPKYDNYDAIEVSKTADIPCDYYDVMGVPITFMDKYNPEQFEIIGIAKRGAGDPALRSKVYTKEDYPNYSDLNAGPVLMVNGVLKNTYPRLLIKRRINK